jgi:molecular chaperone Hsp33
MLEESATLGTGLPGDELVRTLSAQGGISVRAVVGTELVREAASRHATSPVASVALGRALMGAALLATSSKHGESVQLQLRGDGPLGSIVAIADGEGRVRGFAAHPSAETPPGEAASDVGAAVGRGVLTVVRQRADGRAPYSGIVPLTTGTVAQDLAHYLAESEQIRSAVALGVYLDDRGGIEAAGGFTVEALPGAAPDEIERAEANVHGSPGPGELAREGLGADAIADRLLAGLGSRERHYAQPVFHCGCGRDRVRRAVTLLGREELERTVARAEPLEIHCRFCADTYTVSPEEIANLLREVGSVA